jgi:hypothetical protein
MTVRRDDAGTIILSGECPVEDAETLLEHLQAHPDGPVDWSGCRALHTAVLQVLMAAKPRLLGECGDEFVRARVGMPPRGGLPDEARMTAPIEKSES